MSGLRQQTATAWQSDPPSFADYLPYLTCVEHAVLLVDRLGQAPSIGGLWELEPVCVEGAPEERWESVSSAMDGLLARLPEDTAVQFYLLGDPHISEELATFTRQGHNNGVIGATAADRVRLYEQSLHTPLFEHKGIPFRCRRVRAYWEQIKVTVMTQILREKFRHPVLRAQLVRTHPRPLVEVNAWGDHFWGVCHGHGDNHLGRILMTLRREWLIVAQPRSTTDTDRAVP